jgi:hypothetical protein
MRHRRRLTCASLLCCGLFVAEDPGVIALRRGLGNAWPGTPAGVAIDLALGASMAGYNYAASRYVVTAAEAASIDAAMRHLAEVSDAALAAEPRRTRRAAKRLLRRLNPFNMIRATAKAFAGLINRLRPHANHRSLAGVAELLGELAAVNVLGVPGAGLESVARREAVGRRTSLRHAVLFVASWFAGARLFGGALGALHAIPVAGNLIRSITAMLGTAFDTATDVTHPVGAAVVAIVVTTVARFSRMVERMATALD